MKRVFYWKICQKAFHSNYYYYYPAKFIVILLAAVIYVGVDWYIRSNIQYERTMILVNFKLISVFRRWKWMGKSVLLYSQDAIYVWECTLMMWLIVRKIIAAGIGMLLRFVIFFFSSKNISTAMTSTCCRHVNGYISFRWNMKLSIGSHCVHEPMLPTMANNPGQTIQFNSIFDVSSKAECCSGWRMNVFFY